MQDETVGRGRILASPAFAGDDGRPDPRIRALLAAAERGEIGPLAVARALREERLLASVVAVLDGVDEAGGDKDSHMAVVSMLNEAGERGLLAFTGVDALAAWDPAARPVPASGRDTARAALDDGASALVLDVAGPARVVLTGPALRILCDDLDLAAAAAVLQAALAPLTSDGWAEAEVIDARPIDAGVDVIVQLTAPSGGHPDGRALDAMTRQAADIITARPDIHTLVPGGIGVTSA